MKTTLKLLIAHCSLFITHYALSQGSIDVDTNIQMGIAGNEHVKITTSNFSIHQDAANPLIYGDFGTGNVGIGTSSPASKVDVNGNIQISNSAIPMGLITEVGGTTPLLNLSINFREPNRTNSYLGASFRIDARSPTVNLFQWLFRDANSSTENTLMVLTQIGNVGIGTTSPAHTLDVNGTIHSSRLSASDNVAEYILGGHALTLKAKPSWTAVPYIQWIRSNGQRQGYMGWTQAYLGLALENGHSFAITGGNVGINQTNPSYKLDVNGSLRYTSGGLNGSDGRWKTDISKIESASQLVNGINPVHYFWQVENYPEHNFDSRKHYGVIAQELEEILPELVDTDNEGFKSVDYTSLIAILIKAVQEKNGEIDDLRVINKDLRSKDQMLESRLNELQEQLDELRKPKKVPSF